MLAIAILFVVVSCQCLGFDEQVPDTATIQNQDPLKNKLASLLRDHEATTAFLLREHDDKWASLLRDQESKTASLLREQDDKWASLLEATTTSLLRDQESKTASLLREQDDQWASLLEATTTSLLRDQESKTASLLREQDTMLADLTSLLQQQGEKLSDQEHLLHKQEQKLSYQERSHRQLEQKVSDQEDLLRYQDQKLSHQESLLQEQGARLSFQEALLLKQGRVILQLKNRHATDISHPKTPLPGKTSDSASHDVIPRSDDAGPWEAVVSQISQRVTEMGGDIQVFKTQTVNDINALKTQTSGDIQTLKTQTSGDIQTLQNSNRQQDLAIQDAQSSTFVHWGSSTCSSLSHTVYSGVVGGSWYDHSGVATNYLCLTMSPVFSDHKAPRDYAGLYGGEYQTEDSHQDKDPVCAVCQSTLSTTLMIPGTNVCTPGWHLQYSGFLMAGHYGYSAGSEYICVDSKLENTVHDDANEDGVLLFYTVTRCGSLPCSPYVNNKVVTCAVCSK